MKHGWLTVHWKFVVCLVVLLAVVAVEAKYLSSPSKSEKVSTVSTEWASPSKARGSSQKSNCSGNAQDICVQASTLDLYPSGSETAENPHLRNNKADVWKSAGGVIEKYADNVITIRTTSGKQFNFDYGFPVLEWWNTQRSPYFDDFKLGVGDTVRIDYNEPRNEHAASIGISQIRGGSIAIDPTVAADQPVRHYKAGQ